ncbi:hypothetical protein N836_22185 [Leptolyngbya sp. Heron Island J]|nr:hypothetical protein N836_22185 [Leptolyngbya sp. Heron Island J]
MQPTFHDVVQDENAANFVWVGLVRVEDTAKGRDFSSHGKSANKPWINTEIKSITPRFRFLSMAVQVKQFKNLVVLTG